MGCGDDKKRHPKQSKIGRFKISCPRTVIIFDIEENIS